MVDERFLRTSLLLGEDGLRRLQNSSVMIVGLGAVGGYALEAVARAGVGHLILVDFDRFELTNVNRQILALTSSVGRKKTDVARERVAEINPACRVETFDMFVNADTLPQLLNLKADYVIDAIDALNPKCCLIEALYQDGIPFISSMGAALRSDPACVRCGRLSDTRNCSLSKFVRKRLRKRGIDLRKINCVFPTSRYLCPQGQLRKAGTQRMKTTAANARHWGLCRP